MTTPLKMIIENFDFIEPENDDLKIIIGIGPYKQKLGNTSLRVTKLPQKPHYQKFNEVAFFVNEWIKIQDSLEMIFNLLCTPQQTLGLLNYLKVKKISPTQFADFLYEKYKIVLVNRFDINLNCQKNKITALINRNLDKKIHILFVGKKATFQLPKNNNIEFATAVHSSGVVLNTYPDIYYRTWYKSDDTALLNKTTNFTLKTFKILN